MLARRRAIDFARKESRRPQLEPLQEAESITNAPVDSGNGIDCDSEAIEAALKHLPDETRLIFSLHFDRGMTHPEIAEKTGLPLGTIKTRLRRGLIEVRNKLRNPKDSQSIISASP